MIWLGSPRKAGEGPAVIQDRERFRHLYVLGKTQSGKSTLFINLIKQEFDNGIIVLDPAGAFAEAVASLAPPERLVYVDKNHPLVINPMRRGLDRGEIANDLIEVINNCVTGTTPSIQITMQMGEIIRNAMRVIPDSKMDISYLMQFLNLETVRDNYRADDYWQHFDDKDKKGWYVFREKRESASRVGARLSAFVADEKLKRFSIGENQLNIKEIAEDKKIVVFDFKGLDNDLMIYLGNLVTTAVKRYYMHEATPHSPPLFVYVDEFHLFVSPAIGNMLAECAKYNISLNLSHHTFSQTTPKIIDLALSNAYSKVIFTCGYEEAQRLANETQLKANDFLKLKPYEAIAQIGTQTHHIRTFPPPELTPTKQYYWLKDDWVML